MSTVRTKFLKRVTGTSPNSRGAGASSSSNRRNDLRDSWHRCSCRCSWRRCELRINSGCNASWRWKEVSNAAAEKDEPWARCDQVSGPVAAAGAKKGAFHGMERSIITFSTRSTLTILSHYQHHCQRRLHQHRRVKTVGQHRILCRLAILRVAWERMSQLRRSLPTKKSQWLPPP